MSYLNVDEKQVVLSNSVERVFKIAVSYLETDPDISYDAQVVWEELTASTTIIEKIWEEEKSLLLKKDKDMVSVSCLNKDEEWYFLNCSMARVIRLVIEHTRKNPTENAINVREALTSVQLVIDKLCEYKRDTIIKKRMDMREEFRPVEMEDWEE